MSNEARKTKIKGVSFGSTSVLRHLTLQGTNRPLCASLFKLTLGSVHFHLYIYNFFYFVEKGCGRRPLKLLLEQTTDLFVCTGKGRGEVGKTGLFKKRLWQVRRRQVDVQRVTQSPQIVFYAVDAVAQLVVPLHVKAILLGLLVEGDQELTVLHVRKHILLETITAFSISENAY
jgi:hypothetical protein